MKKAKGKNSEREGKKLAEKVMTFFGRVKEKKLFLSLGDIAEIVGIKKESAIYTASILNADGKVAILTNRSGELIYLCRITSILKYKSEELIQNLSDKYFNQAGAWLQKKLAAKKAITLDVKELAKFEKDFELPAQLIAYFLNCFADCGLIEVGHDRLLSLTSKNAELTASKLRNILIAKNSTEVASAEEKVSGKEDVFAILKKLHARHDKETKMAVIPIEVEDSFKIQHICEIRIGHQDTDVIQLEEIVQSLEARTKAELPSLLVVTGLIQGTFQHIQKSRRNTLVTGLKSDGKQLAVAKKLLKRITHLGIKVVVNKGDDDKIWAENTALFMMDALEKHDKPNSKKKSLSYIQIDRMKGTKRWDKVYDFVWRIALEYQLRAGRRLYSADEVAEKTDGAIKMEESAMLLEAYDILCRGEAVSSEWSAVLEVEKIPLPGKVFDNYTVVDDCQFQVQITDKETGKKSQILVMEKHFFRLTATSMISDPTAVLRAINGQIKNMGGKVPNYIFVEHEEQSLIFSTGSLTIVSLPGMQKMNIERRSQNANVQSDPIHRIATTRREVVTSGTMPFTIFPDKSFEASLFNRYYMEKANISKDRIAIPIFADWQTGSISASSDLQAIFLDFVLHELLPNHPTYLQWLGDINHGFNYPYHAIENQLTGLISADSQKEFNEKMIYRAVCEVPKKHLVEYLMHVGIVPGNHEWNSGSKWPGVVHCDMIKSAFELGLMRAGAYDPALKNYKAISRVKVYDSALDRSGNFMKVWASQQNIGGYGFRFQHLIVEKGARGTGGLPIYALKSQLCSNDFRGVDFLATGHWHNPELLKIGNTTGVINGSLAGPTGYEYLKALKATLGATVFYVGGNQPPSVRFMNAETLANYQPKGFYSEKNLNELGFKTDSGFNRLRHGFIPMDGQPQSAIQKYLWSVINKINREPGSIFG